MVRFHRLLTVVALPIALLAAGRPAEGLAGPRLLAPRAGSELVAGSVAQIAWENPPVEAEEWEAFLSLDGGRTYPVRITPHLDIAIRRFSFPVPSLPTRQARVLLRFGDERREVAIEAPQRFAIAAGRAAWPVDLEIALSRGESPRPRAPGVVIWRVGSRTGGGLREVVAEELPTALRSLQAGRSHWFPLFWPVRHRDGLVAPGVSPDLPVVSAGRVERNRLISPPQGLDVRLQTHRFNE